MKNCPLASPHDATEEASTDSARLGRRIASSLGAAAVLALALALAFPGGLGAQTNLTAPFVVVQPQSQSVWRGTTVTFLVAVFSGGATATLPPVGSGTLQLWLRADAGVIASSGGQVSQWQDQSGYGNNAGQTNTNQQPVLVHPPAIGEVPAVRFSGIQNLPQSEFLFGPGAVGVPDALTTFMLYEMNSGTIAEQMPFFIGVPGTIGGGCRGNYVASGEMAFTTWAAVYSTGYLIPTNSYRIWTDCIDTNEDLFQLFDDTFETSTNFSLATSGQGTPGPGYYVGGLDPSLRSVGSSRNFGGDIAEIIVYRGELSDFDRLAVVNYLKEKYYRLNGPGLRFQWLFNGTNVAGATNAFLTLANVQAAQAGTYSVVASDDYGTATSSNAMLEVNLIPIILAQPTNEQIFSNQPFTLSVLAEGPLPLQYQWTLDGTNIIGATNSALVFSHALPSEAGTYAVIVGTEPNATVSSNAVLTVLPYDQIVTNLDAGELNTAVQAGGTVALGLDGTIVLSNTITISTNVILEGANHSITISGGGAVELFNVPAGLNLTLRNLTLANGLQIGQYVYMGQTYPGTGRGGAIYTQGNLDIENCTFASNGVISPGIFPYDGGWAQGGAIYNAGTMTISNSSFVHNSAVGGDGAGEHASTAGTGLGGAICNNGGTISLGNVVFSNNGAVGGSGIAVIFGGHAGGALGGAIFSSGGVVAADNIEVLNNSARGGGVSQGSVYFGPISGGSALGGALYLTGATIAISNSSFSSNYTSGSSADGGAPGQSLGGCVFNAGSALFSGCSFTGSVAYGALGEDYYGMGSAASPGVGGAIYNASNLQIQGGNFVNNSAVGGSVEEENGGNPADGMGGAVYNTGSLEIEGVILSQNNAVGPSGFSLFIGTLYGNGWGGAIYSTGFVVLNNASLSSNATSGQGNYGQAIYNTGVIQSDTNSTLLANVTGTPPLNFQWQINGTNIADATNSTFNLGNVQFADSGSYDLVISNAAGLVTNFEEIVNLPPPPLTIASVTPNTGLTSGGTSVTITGTGFTNGATVSFGNAAATSVTVASATNITANTPPAATAGAVNVVVINGDFQSVVLTNGFTYEAPVFISTPQQGGTPGSGTNGTFIVNVGGAGIPGCNFVIECSINLVDWQPLQTNPSPFIFTDTNAANNPLRFYRAVLEQ
jgi:hypothetical protein